MKSVLSPNVMDIASDVAELALDSVMDEGSLKDIPVFGWGVKLYGAASAVKERIFLNKVAKSFRPAQISAIVRGRNSVRSLHQIHYFLKKSVKTWSSSWTDKTM